MSTASQLAEGSVDSDSTTLIGRDGKAVVNGGAPNLGFAIAQGESPFNPLALVEGDWPGPNEVVIDTGTAKDENFKIGDVVGVQAEGPVERLKVSGIVRLNASISIGGATLAGFDLPTAQRLFKKVGKLDEIAVAAAPGTSDAQLVENISAVLPPGTQVRSGLAQAEDDAADTNEFITFLQGFLLAFAGIALFVGSFVIANSLSITIAQRAREFATVRTLGGSRRQILNSIIVEALVVGTAASVVGLFLGLGLAKLLFWLFDARRLHAAEQRPALRDADDRRLAGRRDHRDAARQPASRHPRDARATDRRRPRGGDAAAVALRPFPHGRLAPDDRPRLRRPALRALRQRSRDDADPPLDGRRRAADLRRRLALRRPARPAARGSARRAGRTARRLRRDGSRATTHVAIRSGPPRPRRR